MAENKRLKSGTSRKFIQYGAGVLALGGIILFISLSGFFFPKEEKILAPPLRKPEEIVYTTYEVKKSSIENRITCRGYFIPEKQVDVSFDSRDGYLKALYVSAGRDVSRGQVLAALDTDTLENEIEQQTLVLEGAGEIHARLKEISDIDIRIYRLRLEELKKDLDTSYQMEGSLAKADIEKMENNVQIQEHLLNKQILEYTYDISAAERDIEMARLQLKELKLELEKSIIRAPISGELSYVAALNLGEYIPAYKTIARIADTRGLILQYTGDDYVHFRLGMIVDVEIKDKGYTGIVVMTPFQIPAEDYEQMKETIRIRVKNSPPGIEIDDPAIIGVTLDKADNVIVLPKRLVHSYGGRQFVKILENDMVKERDVETGVSSPTLYEITGGLEPGDLVVE